MISPELLQLVRDAAIANDLEPYVEQILALVRPSVVLATARAGAGSIPVGATKIGGAPDLPDSLEWPEWNDQPLAFLGQVNLTETAPFQLGLPSEGLLLFFFCFDSELKATRPQNTGAGVVYHVKSEKLCPRKPPQRDQERFRKCSARLIAYPSLPPPYSEQMEKLWGIEFLEDDELHAAYGECLHSIDEALGINDLSTTQGYNYHQLMGYPHAVQHTPIEIRIERARNRPRHEPPDADSRESFWQGFKNFVFSPYPAPPSISFPTSNRPRPIDDFARCRDWQLLFMLQEDEHAGIGLIDSGCVYYIYPSEQLRGGDFSKPWTMLDFG